MTSQRTPDLAVTSLVGGCVCGEVRYAIHRKPLIVHCCHCSWCQRETGSGFVINALIETNEIDVTEGSVRKKRMASASGAGQVIARCPECLVAVWSHYAVPEIGERLSFLRVGTLDSPCALPPDVHIYVASKLPWVELSPTAHWFHQYYRLRDIWSADSLQRRDCLRQRGSIPIGC